MGKSKFPVIWTVVFVFAVIWFAKDMGWLSESFNFAWLPAIIAIFALGAIINHLR